MIILGVELAGSVAIVVVVEKDTNGICIGKDFKKISLNSTMQADVQNFHVLFVTLIDQYSPSKLIINSRQQKGAYAGGADTFIMEGVLLTLTQVAVSSISGQTLKAKLKAGTIKESFNTYPKYTQKAFQLASMGCL